MIGPVGVSRKGCRGTPREGYMKNIAALAVIFLASCSTSQMGQQLNANTNYRMEIPITVDGVLYSSAATLPQKSSYAISFQTKDKPLITTITTCHREMSLLTNSSQQSVMFNPVPIEIADSCPIHIATFSSKIWYRGATLLLQNPALFSVRASVSCNGESTPVLGMGICQAKTGLLEQVSFQSSMNIGTPNKDCAMPSRSQDSKIWTFTVSSGECQFKFGEQANPVNQFIMTTEGYDSYLLPNGG